MRRLTFFWLTLVNFFVLLQNSFQLFQINLTQSYCLIISNRTMSTSNWNKLNSSSLVLAELWISYLPKKSSKKFRAACATFLDYHLSSVSFRGSPYVFKSCEDNLFIVNKGKLNFNHKSTKTLFASFS